MGQKVSPHGLRVGVIKDWDSKWYADKKSFADNLIEDNKIREFVKKKLYAAGISRTVIERAAENQIKVTVMADKPGIVIGRSGDGINEIKKALEKLTGKTIQINIIEVKRSELDAQLTAENIAQALEKRISFRRAMKQAIGRTMKADAKGIRVLVSGRLGGAEIARNEKYNEGNVPLHTLRANIDYGFAEADTTYGKIGVKVWINLGEVLDKGLISSIPDDKADNREKGRRGGRRDDRGRRDGRRGRDDRGRRDGRRGRDGRPEIPKAVNPRKRVNADKDKKKVSTAEAREAEEAKIKEAESKEIEAKAEEAKAADDSAKDAEAAKAEDKKEEKGGE